MTPRRTARSPPSGPRARLWVRSLLPAVIFIRAVSLAPCASRRLIGLGLRPFTTVAAPPMRPALALTMRFLYDEFHKDPAARSLPADAVACRRSMGKFCCMDRLSQQDRVLVPRLASEFPAKCSDLAPKCVRGFSDISKKPFRQRQCALDAINKSIAQARFHAIYLSNTHTLWWE